MTSHGTSVDGEPELHGDLARRGPADPVVVMGAVREDIRQTLRTGWIDPAIEAASAEPVFVTAAWSAIRPNVGKSFLTLARGLRSSAVQALGAMPAPPNMWQRLDGELTLEERQRVEQCVKAAHLATAKAQIVVHALHRVAKRDRLPGTGREEASVRRGVPEWQRWMSFQPASDEARALLEEASEHLGMPGSCPPLRLLARWPGVLASLWEDLRILSGTDRFVAAAMRLRRLVIAGVATLPHPVDLQWTALRSRGFSEEQRARLASTLAWHDGSMAAQTLTAAFVWMAFGGPEIGTES